jgi:hypothetical protein
VDLIHRPHPYQLKSDPGLAKVREANEGACQCMRVGRRDPVVVISVVSLRSITLLWQSAPDWLESPPSDFRPARLPLADRSRKAGGLLYRKR